MIQSQLKVRYISKSIGLAFEGSDFVIDTFDRPARDGIKVIV